MAEHVRRSRILEHVRIGQFLYSVRIALDLGRIGRCIATKLHFDLSQIALVVVQISLGSFIVWSYFNVFFFKNYY